MRDLNDLYYFTQVVKHGGFAVAARELGVAKSKLSRRVSALEQRLGIRLIQRSTRSFSVTAVGREYHQHCLAMLASVDAAEEVIERNRNHPTGTLRISCPTGLLHPWIQRTLNHFLNEYPRIRIYLEATSREVDVIGEGFDVALQVRFPPLPDSELVVHTLGYGEQCLVAAPELLARFNPTLSIADLEALPSVDFGPPAPEHAWVLEGPAGERAQVMHRPRLVADDLAMLHAAARDGVGVAQLPSLLIADDLAAGTLQMVLPEWHSKIGILQAVFPSRQGLRPAVRHLLDMLSDAFTQDPAFLTRPHWEGQEAYRLEAN